MKLIPCRLLFSVLLSLFVSAAWATGSSYPSLSFTPDLHDKESLQRGARIFLNYCTGCHSASYMRYERLGIDLQIPDDIMKRNLMPDEAQFGETIVSAMQPADGEAFFHVAPPELSLIGRSRKPAWLYTYLMTFYKDPSRPTGVNNAIFRDTAMPHVLWQLQGTQRPVFEKIPDTHTGKVNKVLTNVELIRSGLLSEVEYASAIGDLVNFLVYLAEPIKLQRQRLAPWVLFYIFIFAVVAWFLKKEYWRDVKQ